MNKNPIVLKIPVRPLAQRAWVVRASGGVFLQHFIAGGVAAIGHLDGFRRSSKSGEPIQVDRASIDTWFMTRPETSKARASSHSSQTSRFIADISEGDMIVSVDDRSLVVGIATGGAFLSPHAIEIRRGKNRIQKLEYQLRRAVSWGPTIPRAALPYAVEQSLYSHQTVFNIDDHAKAIYHLLYPAFVWEDTFHFSLKITRDNEVSNALLAQLLMTLAFLEAISSRESGDEAVWKDIRRRLYTSEIAEQLELSIKAGFMSPGDIWGKLPATAKKMAPFAVLLSVALGGLEIDHIKIGSGYLVDIAGVKIKPIIDASKVKAVTDYLKEHHVGDFIDAVGLKAPKYNTVPLDSPTPVPPGPDDKPVVMVNTSRTKK